MSVRVDQLVLVIDAYNFGYSQMYSGHIKQMLAFQRNCHSGRGYATIVLRGNMVFKSIQAIVSKLIDETQRNKVRLLGNKFHNSI